MSIVWMKKGTARMPCSGYEIEDNLKNGWEKFDWDAPVVEPVKETMAHVDASVPGPELSLEQMYEAKFGKKPHHRMKQSTIEAALNE